MQKDKNLVILAGGISSRMKKQAEKIEDLDKKLIEEANEKSKGMIGVGKGSRPFLDYLIFNAKKAGYKDIVIVIGENDNFITEYYKNYSQDSLLDGVKIKYAIQKIPAGRVKPMGTADALFQAVELRKDWQGQSFSVCNSDNLYSVNALKTMLESEYANAFIDYDRDAMLFEKSRVSAFAVTKKNKAGFLIDIIEKPNDSQVLEAKGNSNYVGVSMNIFRLSYNMIYEQLKNCPFDPVRNEKELPTAIKMMIKQNPDSMFAFPAAEHVPDLTSKEDIPIVKDYLEKEFVGL